MLAGDKDAIYAIAQTGAAPTTAPARNPATMPVAMLAADSTSEMRAADDRLALFSYNGAAWTRLADLPSDVPLQLPEVSLSVVDSRPVIALPVGNDAVRVLRFNPSKGWDDSGAVPLGFAARQLELLPATQRMILWAASESGTGALLMSNDGANWTKPRPLELVKQIPPAAARAIAVAAGNIRLFFAPDAASSGSPSSQGQIFEQCYRFDGTRSGETIALAAPQSTTINPYGQYWTLAAIITLVAVVFAGMRRRVTEPPAVLSDEQTAVIIAPVGLRLAAGLLDLLPVILAFFVVRLRSDFTATDLVNLVPIGPVIAAVVVYLFHTLLTELIFGRSVGKMIVGLQVVSVDGGRPGAVSMLLRNLMRLVDFLPACPVLGLLILISPLRQRAGDILARTLVVIATEQPDDESDEKSRDDSDPDKSS
jgi:uncharacterized RDD family membrane protein YckC